MRKETIINYDYFTKCWLERAERDNGQCLDDADRFISLWIAFNGWMIGKFGIMREADMITRVKERTEMKEIFLSLPQTDKRFTKALKELAGKSVADMRDPNNPSKYKKYEGTFESLIDVLYQIRCNLFHGSKKTYGHDYGLVCLAFRILLPLFKEYLAEC